MLSDGENTLLLDICTDFPHIVHFLKGEFIPHVRLMFLGGGKNINSRQLPFQEFLEFG